MIATMATATMRILNVSAIEAANRTLISSVRPIAISAKPTSPPYDPDEPTLYLRQEQRRRGGVRTDSPFIFVRRLTLIISAGYLLPFAVHFSALGTSPIRPGDRKLPAARDRKDAESEAERRSDKRRWLRREVHYVCYHYARPA